jgi:hypothetical protein
MSDNVTSAESETTDYTDLTDSNPITDYTQVVCSAERKPAQGREQPLTDSNHMDQGQAAKSRSFFSRLFKPG